jgi:hypothetical protein
MAGWPRSLYVVVSMTNGMSNEDKKRVFAGFPVLMTDEL